MKQELKKFVTQPLIYFSFIGILIVVIIQNSVSIQKPEGSTLRENLSEFNQDIENRNPLTYEMVSHIESFEIQEEMWNRYNTVFNMRDSLIEEQSEFLAKKDSTLFSSEADQLKINQRLAIINESIKLAPRLVDDVLYLSILDFSPVFVVLMLAFGVIAAYRLFLVDQEMNILSLYITTKTGIKKLFGQKLTILIGSILFLVLLKIGIDFVFLSLNHFPYELPMQLVFGHLDFNGLLAATTYLIIVTMYHFWLVLLLVGIILVFSQLIKNTTLTFITIGIVILAEFLMFNFISVSSQFSVLKQINLFYIINMTTSNFFVYQAQTMKLLGIGLLCLTFVCLVGFYALYVSYKGLLTRKGNIQLTVRFKNLFSFQLIDVMVMRRYLIVLLIIIGYVFYDYQSYQVIKNQETILFERYQSTYLGKITDSTLARLESEREKIQAAEIISDELNEKIMNNEALSETQMRQLSEASTILQDRSFFQQVDREIQEILINEGDTYIDSMSLRLWLQADSPFYQTILLVVIMLPALLMGLTIGQNLYQSNIGQLAQTTKNIKRYRLNSLVMTLSMNLIIILLVYCVRYLKINQFYPIHLLDTSINNVLAVNSSISIKAYLFVFFVNQWLGLSAMSLMAMFMMKKTSLIVSLIISIGIVSLLLVLPVGLGQLMSPIFLSHPLKYGVSLVFIWMVGILTKQRLLKH
ncbi:MAG: hypothetical protein GX860_10805 [Alcaligenaceae bacterium]|nr:hypothetical protein [Alcaligenaceae bacterium]